MMIRFLSTMVVFLLTIPAYSMQLHITLNQQKSDTTSNATWNKFCQKVGGRLTQSQETQPSYVQAGIFESYDCGAAPSKSEWILDFSHRKNIVLMSISMVQNDRRQSLGEQAFSIENEIDEFFHNISLDYLTPIIMELLPIKGKVTLKNDDRYAKVNRSLSKSIQEKHYVLVSMTPSSDGSSFQYQVYGLLTKGKKKGRGSRKYRRYYKVGESFRGPYQDLYLQDALSKTKKRKKLAKLTKKLQNANSWVASVDSFLFDSFGSSFAGIRAGTSTTVGESLVSESSIISIFAEVRDGPIDGLRLYYDMSPKVTRTVDVGEEVFSWNRFSLGWAFSYELPLAVKPILSRIDFVPKIGVLNLSSKNQVTESGTTRLLEFTAKDQASLGFELGLESDISAVHARFWVANDFAGVSGGDDELQVNSTRAGVDVSYDIFDFDSEVGLEILWFAYGEKLGLERTKEAESTNLSINSLSFNAGYSGFGVNVSW